MSANKKTILLVDDEAPLQRLVSSTLGEEDFNLLFATNGVEALQIARERQPDLVLLDVMMPGPDGYEVCRRLKTNSDTAGIRVVMLTGNGGVASEEAGHAAGADDYIAKPFSPLRLLNRVYELLGMN